MPLVRFGVRNEYGMGNKELYKESKEEPKELLQGVAVAGLVGILRQLGDLAQFAAEVFHGLQEEVTITSSRSRKMMARVQGIETTLPQLEKSMLAQNSHLHFAYTTGSVCHAHPQIEENHFVNGDLPEFIMDSYEECSDPPRLHLLDRFDSGGPGSCLKRYSDPTFFKKASAISGESNSRLSKCRKTCRSKKERARQRTVSSCGPSLSSSTDRPQSASLQAGVQISPSFSQTVSTYEDTIKSEQEEQPNAFDLRTDSSYIECVFQPTSPMEPEEHEAEQVSISSSQKLPDNSTFDLASVDECTRDVDDGDFRHSPLQEKIRASSSSVSWEEKEEIVDPIVIQHKQIKATDILETEFDVDAEEKEGVNTNIVGEVNFSVENEDLFTSMSSQIRQDDLDSEPDNFMDALNTIESESDTETNFLTKREVERSSILNNDRAKDEIHEQMACHVDDQLQDKTKQEVGQSCNTGNSGTSIGLHELVVDDSDIQSLNLESHSAAYTGSYDTPSFDNPVSTQFFVHEELHKSAEESGNMDISVNNSFAESVNTETISNPSVIGTVNQQNLTSTKVQNTSGEYQANSGEISGVQSVHFWTNGGLLGLEPSKPTVFIAPDTADCSAGNDKDVGEGSLGQINVGGHVEKPIELAQSSEIVERNSSKCSTSYREDSNEISDNKPSWRFLTAVLDAKREKNSYFQLGHSFNSNLANSFGRTNWIVPKNEQNGSADNRALCGEAGQGDMSNGSQISVLSNRIPLNDFQRSLVNSRGQGYQSLSNKTSSEYNGIGPIGSPMYSPSSSPPLQQIKISFQPANDLGTSKLKLKFPDGSFGHETGTYMLPSFQLVPEPCSSNHGIASDSDDGTFCRSSPYTSDDRPGNESDSDSDQWDSDDNPQIKDNEACSSIHNISLKETVSTSTGSKENRHGNIDVDYRFQSSYTEEFSEPTQVIVTPLSCLSAMNPLFEQEIKILSDANNTPKSHFHKEHAPQPPPLPPSEWGNIKSNFDTIAKKEGDAKECEDGYDLKLLGCNIAPQVNLNQVKQPFLKPTVTPQSNLSSINQQIETIKALALPMRRELEEKRSSMHNEKNQIQKGKVVDEKEDFLHQIRTQSFNLRRTGTMADKPNLTTAPATNARVTAILEKANAIRHVIASDDGEDDDSWSEA